METERAVSVVSELKNGTFVNVIIPGIITLILSGIIIYIIRALMIKSLRHNKNMDEQQSKRLVKIVTMALVILAVVLVIGGHGLQTSSLLAMMGMAGLALSLSVQGLLSNFFSGLTLPVTKPFREGDVIEIGGKTGLIENIGYFNTTLVTIENITCVIPNSTLTSSNIINYSARQTLKVEQTFTVAAGMADKEVRTAILEAIAKDSRILTDLEPFIHLQSFDAMNAVYIVRVSCKSKDYFDVYYALVENVRASFEEHSIEMGIGSMGMNGGGMGQQAGGSGGGRGGMGQQPGGSGGRGGMGQQLGGSGSSRGGNGQQSGGGNVSHGGAEGQRGGADGGSKG